MSIIDNKGLGSKPSRATEVQEESQPAQVVNDRKAAEAKASAPRSSLDLSQWDDVRRVTSDGERDRYYIPPELIPDGFSVEWKRIEFLGKPDKKNIVQIENAGWRPAPSDMFRAILPSGYSQPFVEDGEGMALYIRPMKFTEEAVREGYNTATQKVKDYENSTMNKVSAHKDIPTKVHAFSKSYEKGIPVPD